MTAQQIIFVLLVQYGVTMPSQSAHQSIIHPSINQGELFISCRNDFHWHDYIRKISCWLEWLFSVFPAILFKTNQWYNILLGNTQKDCWVHRKRVLDAIHWLKANNALYYKKIDCHLQLMGHCKNCSLKRMLQIVCKLQTAVFFLSQFTRSKITVPSGQLNYMGI